MIKHSKHARAHIFRVLRNVALLTIGVITVSCDGIPKEVEITHQRELCKFDENEALRGAVNRFKAKQPIHWRRVAETENRILNYRSGEKIEIALGVFKGDVESNIDRWYKQFGQEVKTTDLSKFEQGVMLGKATYYIVEVEGSFANSMAESAPKLDDWGMIAIICKINSSEIVTIKMTGPASEIKKEKKNLVEYANNLIFVTFPEDNK